MNRRIQLIATLVALAVSSLWVESASDRPNILVILVDDLGYGDLACQGSTDLRTPAIDRLFSEGMRFNNFYANCTVCSPSRASLLTGRYPDAVGVPGVIRQNEDDCWGFLDPEAPTIAKTLSGAGYATALIGKWHLGLASPNVPNERGFHYFKGFLGDMMDDYWTHRRGGINWMRENEREIDPEGHATDLFAQWACEYLESRAEVDEPFFLYLAFNAPHDPVQPPPDWLDAVTKREAGIDPKRARLVAFIEHLDARIGDLLETLAKSGLDKETLIVFTSDNGGALRFGANNGPLAGGKGDHLEGGIRVPMAVSWEGRIEAGSSSDNISLLMDLYPTFCQVAGIEPKEKTDGISILPTLMGDQQVTDDRVLFWVRQEGNLRFGGHTYYAARYKNLKILQNTPWEPYTFYDLATDPQESSPLEPSGGDYEFLFRQLMEHIRGTTVDKAPPIDALSNI